MTTKAEILWAPISYNSGAPWVIHSCIRCTRSEAKRSFLEGFEEKDHKKILTGIKFEKVTVHRTKD